MATKVRRPAILIAILQVLIVDHMSYGLPVPDAVDGVQDNPSVIGYPPQAPGQMFPDNMPPPPPGAFNDPGLGAAPVPPQQTGGSAPVPPQQTGGSVPVPPQQTADGMMSQPLSASQGTGGQLPAGSASVAAKVPYSNGNMFPPNMPPPPPGAMNDGGYAPQPLPVKVDQASVQKVPSALPNGLMFPPNMPPPPQGAFAGPPPPQQQRVPDAQFGTVPMAQPTFGQSPYASAPQGNAEYRTQAVANTQITSSNVPVGSLKPVTSGAAGGPYPPSAGDTTDEVPYDPTALGPQNQVSNAQISTGVQASTGVQISSGPQATNGDTESANSDQLDAVSPPESNQPQDIAPAVGGADGNDDGGEVVVLGENTDEAGNSWDSSYESYESEEDESGLEGGSESWGNSEEESDYSFLDMLDLSSSEDYGNADWSEDWSEEEDSAETGYSETWSEEESESEYSDLEWFFNSDESSMLTEVDAWQAASEEEESWQEDMEEEAWEEEEAFLEKEEEEEEERLNAHSLPPLEGQSHPAGSLLILYAIPAVILAVLILMAWRNYSGKIRVVSVSSGEAGKQDWRIDRKMDEQLEPMLAAEEAGEHY